MPLHNPTHKMKVLNLYAGIGGNRKLWEDVEVTAVELNPQIAKIYQDFFPNDKVIVADAHQYLLDHYKEYDFIWSSPPCPTHSMIRFIGSKVEDETDLAHKRDVVYSNMGLYEEIILLTHYCEGKWCVENVMSYYEPLIKPQVIGRHFYWSNFIISNKKTESDKIVNGNVIELQEHNGFDLSQYNISLDKKLLLRNCVNSKVGLHIFNCAFKEKQMVLK